MRVLITGVAGFAGSHLADFLLSQADSEVWGCNVAPRRPAYLDPRVRLEVVDLRDPQATLALLDQARPERVYHLAGQASVSQSWGDPWDTFETNVRAQVNVLEAAVRLGLRPRLLTVGSMEEYGPLGADDLPAREDMPLRPDNPYGVSKVAQDLLGLQYHLSQGLHVVRVRPFNHIGPRQSDRFVAPAFAQQIARIEAGLQPPVIRVGNLDAKRDFTDARDIVRAYHLVLERGTPGDVYNVASNCSRSIREILDGLLALSTAACSVEVDPARLRPADVPEQRGDAAKLRGAIGWEPQIPFAQTLRDLLDYERTRLKAGDA